MNRRNFLKLAGVGIAAPCLPVAKAANDFYDYNFDIDPKKLSRMCNTVEPDHYDFMANYGGMIAAYRLSDGPDGGIITPITFDEFYKPVI